MRASAQSPARRLIISIYIHTNGGTSFNNRRYIEVRYGGRSAWLPWDAFIGDRRKLLAALSAQGLTIIGDKKLVELIMEASNVRDFPDRPICDRVGWNGCYFVLPDGSVFAPPHADAPFVAIDPACGKTSARGSFIKWRREVAKPLTGQPLPMFILMTAFVGPILPLSRQLANPCYELVGGSAEDRLVLQLLACSAFGPISPESGAPYWTSFSAALGTDDRKIELHQDLLLPLKGADLALAGLTKGKLVCALKELAATIDGHQSASPRETGDRTTDGRFAMLTASNAPVASLIDSDDKVAELIGHRLTSLVANAGGSYGMFSELPRWYEDSSSFAASLICAGKANHGGAIRRFLSKLVNERASDEKGLQERIERHMATFRGRACVDLNDTSAVRDANNFGIVFAAAILAREYGCLPKTWRIGPAVLECYTNYRHRLVPHTTFAERLLALSELQETIDVSQPQKPSRKVIKRGRIFLQKGGLGRELFIRSKEITQLMPNWRLIRNSPEVKAAIIKERGRAQNRRVLRKGGPKERFFVFRLAR